MGQKRNGKKKKKRKEKKNLSISIIVMGLLQLAVTWYKIHHAGEQATHWDNQTKENANLS